MPLKKSLRQSFNSTLVQLKDVSTTNRGNSDWCFNSTLVQLKVVICTRIMPQ